MNKVGQFENGIKKYHLLYCARVLFGEFLRSPGTDKLFIETSGIHVVGYHGSYMIHENWIVFLFEVSEVQS